MSFMFSFDVVSNTILPSHGNIFFASSKNIPVCDEISLLVDGFLNKFTAIRDTISADNLREETLKMAVEAASDQGMTVVRNFWDKLTFDEMLVIQETDKWEKVEHASLAQYDYVIKGDGSPWHGMDDNLRYYYVDLSEKRVTLENVFKKSVPASPNVFIVGEEIPYAIPGAGITKIRIPFNELEGIMHASDGAILQLYGSSVCYRIA